MIKGIFADVKIPFLRNEINMGKHNEQQEQQMATLEDFYLEEKVEAFARRYRPVKKQGISTEVFTEGRLREFFGAYPLPAQGDLLRIYLEGIKKRGFLMEVSLSGEPAVLAEEIF